MRSAASRCASGITCPQMFIVTAIAEWPRVSITTRGALERAAAWHMCAAGRGTEWAQYGGLEQVGETRLAFLGSNGVPFDEVNTAPSTTVKTLTCFTPAAGLDHDGRLPSARYLGLAESRQPEHRKGARRLGLILGEPGTHRDEPAP